MRTNLKQWIAGLSAAVATACAPPTDMYNTTHQPDPETGKIESAERIDSSNDPARFQLSLSARYADLPANGESLRKPFPSNWWPMRQNGIARRWLGADVPSPAEKYDTLVTPTRIRPVTLTLAKKDHEDKPVNENAQPENFNIGPAAEWELKNSGPYGTVYPESWWGHCNGWASYVLNEDEPMRAVNVKYTTTGNRITECASATEAGCVRFELGDINALGAELYWSDAARMLGRRCEEADSDFELDESGRVNKDECRDGNPGSLHIVATNMLGRLQRPFIVDLNADRQVWNYPVYRYELVRNQEITLAQALAKVGAPAGTTTWTYNADAKRFIDVQLKLWIVEDAIPPSAEPAGHLLARYTTIENYTYVLELDQNGNIIGGEYTGESKRRHPDFLWYSWGNDPYNSDDRSDRDNPEIRYSIWKQILTLAQQQPASGGGGTISVSATPALAIPDNNATGISSTLTANGTGNVSAVRVKVDITHTYRGDLTVTLEHGGRAATLHSRSGGSTRNLNLDVNLTDFAGLPAAGAWVLKVNDTARADTGTLDAWSLDITTAGGSTGGGGNTGGGTGSNGVYEASPAMAIPDNNTTGISHTINVTDGFTAGNVKVTTAITHTYRGDLVVSISHGGKTVVLHNQTGSGADDLNSTFDVADFAGLDARGAWTLSVSDRAAQDTGTLNRWKLEIAQSGSGGGGGTPPASVTREVPGPGNLSIPDNNATGASQTIVIDEAIRITSLKVRVDVTHTYISDLTITLEKDGVTQMLWNRQGGSADNINQVIDTAAFNNSNVRGRWTIKVVDSAAQDVGKLDGWRLIVVGTPQ